MTTAHEITQQREIEWCTRKALIISNAHLALDLAARINGNKTMVVDELVAVLTRLYADAKRLGETSA